MKKYVISLMFLLILSVFSGCDYYDDVDINMKLTEPDLLGLVEYHAGVSTKENAARLNLLRYELGAIDDGQIKITFPEKIKDDSGKHTYDLDEERNLLNFALSLGFNIDLNQYISFNLGSDFAFGEMFNTSKIYGLPTEFTESVFSLGLTFNVF